MFLIRLIHLKGIKKLLNIDNEEIPEQRESINHATPLQKKEDNDLFGIKDKAETIGQMKNIAQEKDIKIKDNKEIELQTKLISSFDELLEICSSKKEIKLKYELEKNVNLVRFENKRIEISFNEDLDKDFIKDLSSKLYEWTNDRWIITLSKTKGHPSKKEEEIILKKELIETVKKSPIYNDILKKFPDAELIDVRPKDNEDKND
jgi:DNA polymerase III subunit gamma/tau